jgi:hypothetical protein
MPADVRCVPEVPQETESWDENERDECAAPCDSRKAMHGPSGFGRSAFEVGGRALDEARLQG